MRFEEIGSRLRDLRMESKESLKHIALTSGYGPVHICKAERTNSLSVECLVRLLDTYGYEIEFKKREGR